MLPSSDILSRLLGKLYDATTDREQWNDFLRELATVAASDSAAVLMHEAALEHDTVAANWGLHPDVTPLYQQYYGAQDVWVQRALPELNADWVGVSQSLCPMSELVPTEFFNDYLRVYGTVHAMWCVVENSSQKMVNISLYRGSRSHAFEDKDTELLAFLSPHIKRAFRLHSHFGRLQGLSANLQDTLDAIPTGVVLLGEDGRILALNSAAQAVIDLNDGLLATRYGLRANRLRESSELQRLVAVATATSSGKELGPAGGLQVSRKDGSQLFVLITPVGTMNFEVAGRVRAIALVVDPARSSRPPEQILRSIFGLTPAECRVALLLADGKTPTEITGILGVSVNTLKSHVGSIYGKTGVARQSQLIRLLLNLAVGSKPD